MGSYVPFVFSLGHPWPVCFLWTFSSFLLTLHSHRLLLISLGFPGTITSFSSLGFMSLPLTPYFLCLHYFWACSGPFSLFLHHILPMGMLFLSFRASLSPFTFSRPICLFHEPVIHHSCHLGLTTLPLVCQSFAALIAGLFAFHLDPQKWPSTTSCIALSILMKFQLSFKKKKKRKE